MTCLPSWRSRSEDQGTRLNPSPSSIIAKRPEESVTLTFSLDHPVTDPRIVEAVEPHPGHWTHHVVIEDEADLDGPVDAWLREAYALADAPSSP